MTAINIDNARILEGNYIGKPRTSCAKIDYPTEERVTVSLGGKEYDRAVYERVIWRNQGENTLVDRFVWVDGKFYSLTDIPEHSASDVLPDTPRHREAEMSEIQVGGIDFIVGDGLVREWGTARVYDPKARRGYTLDGDRRVSLLSYDGFGSDRCNAEAAAAAWCDKAQAAWDAVSMHKVGIIWNNPYVDERGEHCDAYLVIAGDESEANFDSVDLANYPGSWDTENPYILAEEDLLARNGYTRDDVAFVRVPW